MEELEESLDPHHFHITIRTIAAGTHEAKAVRHASTHTKHVLPLLAVARITSRPKSPGSGNSGPGGGFVFSVVFAAFCLEAHTICWKKAKKGKCLNLYAHVSTLT